MQRRIANLLALRVSKFAGIAGEGKERLISFD
uniref:Uncharacterized protein n=1 Tax=Arundo donax TaxID=35708 RepID=A0A0A8ZFI7_ARUDO